MLNEKIKNFLENNKNLETPFLVLDLEEVAKQYNKISKAFSSYDIYYAVKANPAKEILNVLKNQNSKFDAASLNEIELCLAQGIKPSDISWGSTIKKSCEIKKAYEKGIKLYAFDSKEELEKIANNAPNSKVFCRINVDKYSKNSLWPLSKKFGCSKELAVELLVEAKNKGLHAYGVSFHVGSQQTDYEDWTHAIEESSYVINTLEQKENIKLEMLNIGGGYPAYGYLTEQNKKLPNINDYANTVKNAVNKYINNASNIKVILEPGRFLVADTGVIKTKVVLFSHKNIEKNDKKWLYLDVGLFGGLAETMNEAIKYNLITKYENNTKKIPAYIAGPTCDGVDIMYQKTNYTVPVNLKEDDEIIIQSAGAYTVTYSSIGFNGFNPLKDYYIK